MRVCVLVVVVGAEGERGMLCLPAMLRSAASGRISGSREPAAGCAAAAAACSYRPLPPPPPSPARSYCEHIRSAAQQTVEKLHLMEGLQQKA